MTKSSWRCVKKVWVALSVAITLIAIHGGTPVAFGQDPAQTKYDQAMAYYQWGDYVEAMAAFEELLKLNSTSDLADDAQYMLGQCYVALDQYDDAIFAFYTAAYKYPKGNRCDDALVSLAGILYRQDHMSEALDTYEQIGKTYPRSRHAAYAQTCVGWLSAGMGDAKKARAALEKVAMHYPDSPYAKIARESLEHLPETAPSEKIGKTTLTLDCNTGQPVEGRPVEFSATVSDQGVKNEISYQWYLDGQPVGWTGLSPKWQDPTPGTHHVTLMVFDGKEKQGKTVEFTVAPAAPLKPPTPTSSIIKQTFLLSSVPPSPWTRGNEFSSGDTVYVWVESQILNKPHTLEIVWIDPFGKEAKRERFELRGWGAGETFWSELQTGRQQMQGQWKVDILVDGQVEGPLSFILNP